MFDILDLGLLPYDEATARQRAILDEVAAGMRASTLVFVEHPPVLTLGAAFSADHLLLSEAQYEARGIEVRRTDRGGDVTYHGPGQIVAYPVFDLQMVDRDLHRWLRTLEDIAISTLATFGVSGSRNPINTGVWVGSAKICAIGIKVRRWVSMHGLSLNCDVDLAPFGLIVPCGLPAQYGVTSLSLELGRRVGVADVKPALAAEFGRTFG